MRFETDAFIIHTRPYKETSLIVSFFTKEYGNVSAIAKGAKGKKSKFSGNLEPFRLMNIGFGGKSNLKSLFFSDSLETYNDFTIKKNLYSAFYINELIYSLLPPNEKELIIFNQYQTLIDLIYNPPFSAFMKLGNENGAKTISGLDMFIFQGIASAEIWLNSKLINYVDINLIKRKIRKKLC